jgi:hypothetical protein
MCIRTWEARELTGDSRRRRHRDLLSLAYVLACVFTVEASSIDPCAEAGRDLRCRVPRIRQPTLGAKRPLSPGAQIRPRRDTSLRTDHHASSARPKKTRVPFTPLNWRSYFGGEQFFGEGCWRAPWARISLGRSFFLQGRVQDYALRAKQTRLRSSRFAGHLLSISPIIISAQRTASAIALIVVGTRVPPSYAACGLRECWLRSTVRACDLRPLQDGNTFRYIFARRDYIPLRTKKSKLIKRNAA